MPLLEKQLVIKRSTITGAGKGLFTKKFIAKGSRIIQYKGRIKTWAQIKREAGFNGYVFYVTRNHVVDAKNYMKSLGRFANDAKGITKIKGITNNCTYVVENKKVYVEAIKSIDAGSEIFVPYGKDYWNVIRYNIKKGL